MIGISFPSFIFSRKVLLVALVSSLIQFCACWLRKSIRKGSTTIPFYRHIPRFGHVQRDLISTFILFMRTAVHRLTQDLFSHLLWTVVSLPPFFFFLYVSYFCCAIFHFCTSSVYRTVFFILHSNFAFVLRLVTISLFSLFLSHDLGFFIFAVPFSLILSLLFFSVFLLFSHAHFPFSSFLSLFIFLFLVVFLFCFFFIFSFVCFWFIFLFPIVFLTDGSWCSCGFYCIVFFLFLPLSSFSSFPSLFVCNSTFFRFLFALVFSPTRFFCFLLCVQPSFFSVFWVFSFF